MSPPDQKSPPKGDHEKAEKYVNQLTELINQNKLQVIRTDLKKFDPSSLYDHYTISLDDYQIEISHSKQPDSDEPSSPEGKHSFVMIFNNFKNIAEGRGEKVILAYIYLTDAQFSKFKIVAGRQIEEKRRAEEAMRFKEAMAPIDNVLDQASSQPSSESLESPKASETSADSSGSYLSEQLIHQI